MEGGGMTDKVNKPDAPELPERNFRQEFLDGYEPECREEAAIWWDRTREATPTEVKP
jgi:hypothetical protein